MFHKPHQRSKDLSQLVNEKKNIFTGIVNHVHRGAEVIQRLSVLVPPFFIVPRLSSEFRNSRSTSWYQTRQHLQLFPGDGLSAEGMLSYGPLWDPEVKAEDT